MISGDSEVTAQQLEEILTGVGFKRQKLRTGSNMEAALLAFQEHVQEANQAKEIAAYITTNQFNYRMQLYGGNEKPFEFDIEPNVFERTLQKIVYKTATFGDNALKDALQLVIEGLKNKKEVLLYFSRGRWGTVIQSYSR